MNAALSLTDHIRDLEEQLLRPETRRSPTALGALLGDEFVEFASDGRSYTKAEVIAALQVEASCARSLANFHLMVLADDFALATYRATRQNESSDEIVESLRSSVWSRRANRWQLVFHQGTHVAP
jgi:glyoxylase I family protein